MNISELTPFETQKLIVACFGEKNTLKSLENKLISLCDYYPLRMGNNDGIRVVFKESNNNNLCYFDTYNSNIKSYCTHNDFSYHKPMLVCIAKKHGNYNLIGKDVVNA